MQAATRRWPNAVALSLAIAVALLGAACSRPADSSDAVAQAAEAQAGAAAADAAASPAFMEPAPAVAAATDGGQGVEGMVNRNGSQLAYEHDVSVRLQPSRLADNLARVREACAGQKFGGCDVLGEELSSGAYPTGSLVMRAAPGAISGLVKTAAEGGEVSQRSMHAEDLADAVRDNGLRRKRLEMQHAKLSEILQRRDIKVAELITLTERLAAIESELNGAEQENAQQQRRVTTNRLTLNFESENVAVATDATTRIGDAFRSLTSTWDSAIAWMITVLVGGALPFAIVLGGLGWLLLKLRRRAK